MVLAGLAASAHIILTAALVATCAGLLLISATAAQSLLQLHAPEGARGLLIGIYLALLRAGPALGALALGFLGDQIGLRFALAIGAGLGLVGLLGLASRGRVRFVRAGWPGLHERTHGLKSRGDSPRGLRCGEGPDETGPGSIRRTDVE